MEQRTQLPPIPTDTNSAARALFGSHNLYLVVGDRLSELLPVANGVENQAGESLPEFSVLSLVTVFQYLEGIPDHQASEATRQRVEWKYALHLSLKHPGIKPITLCIYRQNLLSNLTSLAEFQSILDRLAKQKLLSKSRSLNINALQVINTVCAMSRLERLWTSLLLALESLAADRPEWLRYNSLPHWYTRYVPGSWPIHANCYLEECRALADLVGRDAMYLLNAIGASGDSELQHLIEIHDLHEEWHKQFYLSDDGKMQSFDRCLYCRFPPSRFQPPLQSNGFKI